jgi:VanZ family protein
MELRRRLLLLAFLLWIGYTVTFSVMKVPENQAISRFHLDIAFHFSAYLVMAVLGVSLFRWWVLIPGIIIAGGTEMVQHFLPYRTASWSDFGVNLAGITLGLILWWFIRQGQRRGERRSAKG